MLACCAWRLTAAEFYVAPNGSASGNGSLENPWDLPTALKQPTNVVAGDTVWLRGGIYRQKNQPTKFGSRLRGNPFNPIFVRQAPGERAIIDGNLSQFEGGWVVYWDFEIMNSHPNRFTMESGSFPTNFTVINGGQTNDLCVSGFDLRAENVKLVNLVTHDCIGGGIGVNAGATNSELNGTISFYNGWQGCDRAHGHGYYGQNPEPSYAIIANSLFFANYALGFQATSNEGLVDNFYLDSNVLFSNGILARKHQGNLLLGPLAGQANYPTLFHNSVYDAQGGVADVNIGYTGGANAPTLFDNYFQTSVYFSPSNQNLFAFNNTFVAGTRSLEQTNFPDNIYATNQPGENFVSILPNFYEPNRAHVVVYNWEGLSNVAVDVSGVLFEGTDFEVRNAQDLFGAPVLSGTYTGGVLVLPMTNLRVAKPVGTNAPPSTAPEFNVFVLRPRESALEGAPTNTPPVLSPIGDQFTDKNIPSAPIPFSISDAELPAEFLTLSVSSTRPDLVPNAGIRFGGSGTNRTITIVPAANSSGVAIVTLAVSDGFLSASNVFSVTVSDTNNPAADALPNNTAVLTVHSDNTTLLNLAGPPEAEYEVQASTNLTSWRRIGIILTDCTGLGFLEDLFSTNYPARFYRFKLAEE